MCVDSVLTGYTDVLERGERAEDEDNTKQTNKHTDRTAFLDPYPTVTSCLSVISLGSLAGAILVEIRRHGLVGLEA